MKTENSVVQQITFFLNFLTFLSNNLDYNEVLFIYRKSRASSHST